MTYLNTKDLSHLINIPNVHTKISDIVRKLMCSETRVGREYLNMCRCALVTYLHGAISLLVECNNLKQLL